MNFPEPVVSIPVASIAERLATVPQGADIALIVRHTEREEIPSGAFGADVLLTARGVAEAERLGALLGARGRAKLRSSPVLRCVQTAEALVRGGDWPGEVGRDWRLGSPGPFVVEPEVSGPLFLKTPMQELAQRQLSSPKPLPGMRPTSEGVRMILDLAARHLERKGLLNIYITHDAILAVVVAHLFRVSIEEMHWPDYLDGLILWRSRERLHFVWRGFQQAFLPIRGEADGLRVVM